MRVLVTLVGALAFTASPFPKAYALTSDEGYLLSRINAERSSNGIGQLSLSSELVAIARKHSADMAAKGAIYHNSNVGSEVDNWKQLGENVGRGPAASAVHNAFMASASHRTHILNGAYDRVGVGTVWKGSGSSKMIYVTEIFVDSAGSTTVFSTASSPKKHISPPKRRAVPKPKPAPAVAVPMTVDVLLELLAMDATVEAGPAPTQSSPELR
ncbi:MAG: CAP domain-containing protein [Actinomycetota bacterium]